MLIISSFSVSCHVFNTCFFQDLLQSILLCDKGFNPLPNGKILDWFKLKQFADDNFKFDEYSRKFSKQVENNKQVENTVGKGEITHYEQFLLFLQCFQKGR